MGSTFSKWESPTAGVPQGTLLGPVCFLLHINDLHTDTSNVKYVDDTTIWESCNIDGANSKIQAAADQAATWSSQNNMLLNTDKTKEMSIYFGRKPPQITPIHIAGKAIHTVHVFKLLGVMINDKLTWNDHVEFMVSKASRRIYFLCLLKRAGIPPLDIVAVYCSIIRSVLEYASEIWHPGLTQEHTHAIEHIQKRAMDIAFPDISYAEALTEAKIETLEQRRTNLCRKFFQNISDPCHKLNYLLPTQRKNLKLRHSRKFQTPKIRTDRIKHSPVFYGLFNFQDKI